MGFRVFCRYTAINNPWAMHGATKFTSTLVRNTGHESKGKPYSDLDRLPTPGIRDYDPAFLPEFRKAFSAGSQSMGEETGMEPKLEF